MTLSTGLTSTLVAYGNVGREDGGARIHVTTAGTDGDRTRTRPRLSDPEIEERLRSLPDAEGVRARALAQASMTGQTLPVFADFYRGDNSLYDHTIVKGRAPAAAGEIVAGPAFLTQRGLKLGDRVTLELNGRKVTATVVGQVIEGNARAVEASWATYGALAPGVGAAEYTVRLAPGADARAYAEKVAALDPALHASVLDQGNAGTATVIAFATVFTALLTTVAALGVFNTVLLNIRERRRDLGMLKSIGMPPRQVVLMTVTSVAGLGAVGGLLGIPLGIAAHRLVVDHVGVVAFPESMKDVWHAPQLAAMLLAGVLIAVLGALVPARSAARMTIASVLHTE